MEVLPFNNHNVFLGQLSMIQVVGAEADGIITPFIAITAKQVYIFLGDAPINITARVM